MKKVFKTLGIAFLCIVAVFGIFVFNMFRKAGSALAKQQNAVIDMNKVEDGTYKGSSDGGLVKVEVEVVVKDHAIKTINLLKHDNGKGKPAEATLHTMVEKNTDDVDVVTGATASSQTIRNAVNVALQKGIK